VAPQAAAVEPVRVRVLGSLRLGDNNDDGAPLRSARLRRLFVVLLARRSTVVSGDSITQFVWGDGQPADPSAALQTRVWRLREVLRDAGCDGAARLLTRAPGYLLRSRASRPISSGSNGWCTLPRPSRPNALPSSSRRPCRCGADRRTRSSPMTRSSGPRPPGWRSFGSPRSQTGSRRCWRLTGRTIPSPGWPRSSRRTRCGNDPGHS
jgi:hypothetical protein